MSGAIAIGNDSSQYSAQFGRKAKLCYAKELYLTADSTFFFFFFKDKSLFTTVTKVTGDNPTTLFTIIVVKRN